MFGSSARVSRSLRGIPIADPTACTSTQRISYAKSTSHATIAQTEGPEAVYAIKLGLRDAEDAGKKSKMTVSAAQKKLANDRRKEKRGRDDEEGDEEEEEEDDEDEDAEAEGPQKKKIRQDGEDEDGALSLLAVVAARRRRYPYPGTDFSDSLLAS